MEREELGKEVGGKRKRMKEQVGYKMEDDIIRKRLEGKKKKKKKRSEVE